MVPRGATFTPKQVQLDQKRDKLRAAKIGSSRRGGTA